MMFPPLKLKKNEDKRLRGGHLWVFSNEVDNKATPLGNFTPGEIVTITNHVDKPLGNAYINPHSLICARIFSRDINQQLDGHFLQSRLKQAQSLRDDYFAEPYYRLAFSEADLIPGLIIDRFGQSVVVQISTLGMELRQADIIASIEANLQPETIIINNQTRIRELEGLECYSKIALGSPGEYLEVDENNCRFYFPAVQGQKTGWFYDHRINRRALCHWVKGKRVLDVFSYLGGWGIQAAAADASHVTCIDSSALACDLIRKNAQANNVDELVSIIHSDAFDSLQNLKQSNEKFDVIVLDPPAFVKRKKDIQQGTIAYQRLNKLAMQLLLPHGILTSASCSYHFSREQHLKMLSSCAQQMRYSIQIIQDGGLGPDHPVHPAIPETNYLSCFTVRVLQD